MGKEKQQYEQPSSLTDLSGFDRYILQVIAIIYEPVSVSFLSKCVVSFARFPCSDNEVKESVARLHEAGLLGPQNQCLLEQAEILVRESVAEGWFADFASLVEERAPVSFSYGKWTTRCWRALRQFRFGVYRGDFTKIDESEAFFLEHCFDKLNIDPPAVVVATKPFSKEWFGDQPASIQFFLVDRVMHHNLDSLSQAPELINYIEDEENLPLSDIELIPFRRMRANLYLVQGKVNLVRELIDHHPASFTGTGFSGAVSFLSDDLETALSLFSKDMEELKKFSSDDQFPFFFGLPGLFYVMALIARGHDSDIDYALQGINSVLTMCNGGPDEVPFLFMGAYTSSLSGEPVDMAALSEHLQTDKRAFSYFIAVLSLYWMGAEIPPELQQNIADLSLKAEENGFIWLAMEMAELLALINPDNYAAQADKAADLQKKLSCRSIAAIASPDSSWEHSLQELISVSKEANTKVQTSRLAWCVKYLPNTTTLQLTAREQKRQKKGGWSKGRVISLNRLASGELDYLSEQDKKICAALLPVEDKSARSSYRFDLNQALPELIGHPFVFLDSPSHTPVEIVAGEPELMVETIEGELFVHFIRDIGEKDVVVWQETPSRFIVAVINEEHRRVADIIGRDGLKVPKDAGDKLLDAIGNIVSFMTVHSSMDLQTREEDVVQVSADSTPHVHIIPYGGGFRLEMFVQPFSRLGPYLKPGVGVSNLVAEVNGKRMLTQRNLELEEERAREVEESCPMLDLAIDLAQGNPREWHLHDPEECLQALLELDEIKDMVVLEWPEGEKIAVRRQVGVNQLNLNIRTAQENWFALKGNVQVDEESVIELKNLLDEVKKNRSRFIPLEDGQFLALTQEFRDRLEELIIFGDEKQDDELYIHALAAPALEKLTAQAQVEVDDGWKKQLRAISNVHDFVPEIPSTLQAELRDYQVDGFVWMTRLAKVGIGACLADDMGLGKTLQSLAVILYYAGLGPTLVVAPTSVCLNWQQEAAKFAPTLKVHMFSGQNRQTVIDGLGKYDLLITSYTMLHQEIEQLEKVKWQSVVLDEAQAIKNAGTKRSRAAKRLQAKFRLITTGTPIENHLGELWNLFSFINPGMLGTFKQFNKKFGIPIERQHDKKAQRKLKKLVRPFMLRRIKSQVLDELPPRTEITLRVEMSAEERNFYEAIRRQALENIESGVDVKGKHIRILAEIMKLRRACCNPSLVNDDVNIASSKLAMFAEVINELLDSNHKALVFSQFTGHLALIRDYLDKEGIEYKYLDGTTPPKERQKQVNSFQEGEGDLFLISLKAGGLGLNLTAADYVIHMDPWWNPAVEDQAADRAHRIGQKRPVTVYRLVAVNTIEEKIVELHREKRDLANSLLDGTDVAARLSADDLLNLIREV